ncbi:MAG: HAD-IA family hydrolase [Magnetococcus sp. DMHC-6]
MNQPVELIIFDCDGTLVDSLAGIAQSARLALEEMGISRHINNDEVASVVGLSLEEALAQLLPGQTRGTILKVADRYRFHYKRLADSGQMTAPMFPGVKETLEKLKNSGILLGVATGKSLKGLLRCLNEHDLTPYFAAMATADDAPSKPHPGMIEIILSETGIQPDRTLMVGDTDFDIQMGQQAGVQTCAVTYGCHSRERLAESVPDFWLDQMDHLPAQLGIEPLQMDDFSEG